MIVAAKVNSSEKIGSVVARLYRHRFPVESLTRRAEVWAVLCRSWLAKYIPHSARVLEVAAGYCEFINNIEAIERVAIDLNPETKIHAAPGITVYEVAAERLADIVPHAHFDTVFMSNFLEHCQSCDQVLAVLRAVLAVLKPGGRHCYKDYFDYFDHHLALTENAVVEALELSGFEVELVKPRTLPFSFRSRLPSRPSIVWLYLQLPYLWSIFGSQFFIIGKKTD